MVLNEPWIFVFLGHQFGDHAPGFRDPALALRASHVVEPRPRRGRPGGPRRGAGERADRVRRSTSRRRTRRPTTRSTSPPPSAYHAQRQRLVPRPAPARGRTRAPSSTRTRRSRRWTSARATWTAHGDRARLHRAQHVLPRHRRPRPGGRPVGLPARPGHRAAHDHGLGGLAGGAPPDRHADPPRLRHQPIYITENGLRGADRPWRRRPRARRGPGRLPGRPHRPARPGDRRRLRRPRATSRGPCSTTSSGRPATRSASGSCGWTSTTASAGSSRTAAGGCAISPGPARSSTTRRWPDRSARSRRPARQAGRACSTNRPIRRSASSSRSYEVA